MPIAGAKGYIQNRLTLGELSVARPTLTLSPQADRKKFNEQTKEIQQLKSELNRKEKALAEAATLLILKKKPIKSGGMQRTTNPAG